MYDIQIFLNIQKRMYKFSFYLLYIRGSCFLKCIIFKFEKETILNTKNL